MIPETEGQITCFKNSGSNMKEGLVIEEWQLTNNCKSVLSCCYSQNAPFGFSKFETINTTDDSANCTFRGELINKKAEGYGIYRDINGEYEGEWNNDSQTGIGIEQLPDNSNYSGEFKNGNKDGIGIYKWADGTYYAGEWKNNIFNGFGIYKFQNGQIYRGHFVSGVMNGYGELIWPNGDAYFGGYTQGKRNGFGLYSVQKNQKHYVYIGFFSDNKMNGCGKLMNGSCEKYGIWNMGKFERKLEQFEFNTMLDNNGLHNYAQKFTLNYSAFKGYYGLCLGDA
ncbi:MAG: hypothetical protein MJ252_05915 [archaeon]|nr:hypothetical protein [archaeon]